MKISIGTNIFDDCESQITIAGVSLFSIKNKLPVMINQWIPFEPPLITFKITSPPAKNSISVVDNKVQSGNVTVDTSSITVKIYYDTIGHALALDSVDNPNVHNVEHEGRVIFRIDNKLGNAFVQFDLRPLGLNIFADEASLKIEGATFAHNTFKKLKTGIAIG
ncbi:MAG: hypothetical protein HZB85_06270 [Deltaproteobacteria bacterium]|nr:hypothetical protein [Deltaproteobacteria bacterium]